MSLENDSASNWDQELKQLLKQFISRLPSRLNDIERALQTNNFDEIKALAHKLAGAAGSYGITELAQKAGGLESAATIKDLTFCCQNYTSLKEYIETLKEKAC